MYKKIIILISIFFLFWFYNTQANYKNYNSKNYIQNIKNKKIKKVILFLDNKKENYIKKYWFYNWYNKYFDFLEQLNNLVLKYSNNKKYKKYRTILIYLYNDISEYDDILKNEYQVEAKLQRTDTNTEEYKILDQIVYWPDYNNIFSNLSNNLKIFINYVSNITWWTNELKKIYLTTKKKYEKINKNLNFDLPNIDKKSLKEVLDKYQENWWIMSEKEFNQLVIQSNDLINKLADYKRQLLKAMNWKVIDIYHNKIPNQLGYNYFWNNKFKIIINLYANNSCWVEKDFDSRNWLNQAIDTLEKYSFKNYYKFFMINKWVYSVILYKKTDKCLTWYYINASFNFALKTNNISAKQKIFGMLGAKYLANQYKNLLLLWNNIYFINKDVFNWWEDEWYTLLRDLTNSYTTFSWNKNIYFDKKYINRYNKSILWHKECFFWWDWYSKIWINKENFIYLWTKKFLQHNLYYFYKYLTFLINNNYIIWLVSKNFIHSSVDNVYPKIAWKFNKEIADRIQKVEKIVYENEFKNMKDIYKWIENNFVYDNNLANNSSELFKQKKYDEASIWYDLDYLFSNKKWVCFHFALLYPFITSIYWIPSWYILISKKIREPWHAISIINWNIYDATYEVWRNNINYKWIWHTFVENDNTYWKMKLYYPKNSLKYINKNNPLFKLKIKYTWF